VSAATSHRGGAAGVPHVAVIGGGFCGLAAAYELGKRGVRATVLEADAEVGGLAGGFRTAAGRLEKFYHHWFASDVHIMRLIDELGLAERVLMRPSRTGMYYAGNIFKLSNPVDLLRFAPLPVLSRLRLGLFALWARRLKDWRRLDDRAAADWLRQMVGPRTYDVVWAPLLHGKFGDLAEQVSAAWFWNKIKLRGGSRRGAGAEHLAYYRGGFAALADALAAAVRGQGGTVCLNAEVTALKAREGRVTEIVAGGTALAVDGVIATPALPVIADLLVPVAPPGYVAALRRIRYLANVCVVLELDRSLSETYWLNVNDTAFPFVAVVEHTNLEPASGYAGRHIVYLSRYAPEADPFYAMDDDAAIAFALSHLRRMFPDLADTNVLAAHLWRARYAQPVSVKGYRHLLPSTETPLANVLLASMAQIYPQDRGTNYAVEQGRATARRLVAQLTSSSPLANAHA